MSDDIGRYYATRLGRDRNGRWHWQVNQVLPIPPADTVNPSSGDSGSARSYRKARRQVTRALAREVRSLNAVLIDWQAEQEGRA